MSTRVCLFSAGTLSYSKGGGYFWIYLNWALGLRALGCELIWLEGVNPATPAHEVRHRVTILKNRLERYGLAECLALCSWDGEPLPRELANGCEGIDEAVDADLLLNQRYGAPPEMVGRFKRSALLDIDPGLLQVWMSRGWVRVAPHDMYFTISEEVSRKSSQIPYVGVEWHHAPPCVSLDWWSPHDPADDAAFTTLTHWYAGGGTTDSSEAYGDDKRSGFLPFIDLPCMANQPLELALDVAADANERGWLQARGWRVRDAYQVASTPWDFHDYVQDSLGEFSCAKPSYVRLNTAWISDRTVCYLASAKPVVIQHTGPSKFLPDSAGVFRFRNVEEAARHLDAAMADYRQQCRLARSVAEEYFDAKKVVGRVLESALT
jgi:hypothetical protein